MSGKRGLERYCGAEMGNYFAREHGARFDRQTGSHLHYRLPDGRPVGTLKGNEPVPTALARRNAETLGMTLGELREALGYPDTRTGRRRFKAPRQELMPTTVSRSAAKDALLELRDEVNRLHSGLSSGSRDAAVYEAVIVQCAAASESLGQLAPKFPQKELSA